MIPAPGEPADGPDRQAQEVRLSGEYELAQEFFRWEFATAVAGSILGINPFDQPDVQSAKDKTKEVLASGSEPDVAPEGSAEELFAQAQAGDYVCIQAFINPTAANETRIEGLAASARELPRAVSSRTASGRATCIRPGSCTRAGRRRVSSCRSSTTRARSWRSPGSRSVSGS